MKSKLQKQYDIALSKIYATNENTLDFFKFMGQNYKSTIIHQVMAYDQRPDTQCFASAESWVRINRLVMEQSIESFIIENKKAIPKKLYTIEDTIGGNEAFEGLYLNPVTQEDRTAYAQKYLKKRQSFPQMLQTFEAEASSLVREYSAEQAGKRNLNAAILQRLTEIMVGSRLNLSGSDSIKVIETIRNNPKQFFSYTASTSIAGREVLTTILSNLAEIRRKRNEQTRNQYTRHAHREIRVPDPEFSGGEDQRGGTNRDVRQRRCKS